jgi:hypothetical protein
MDSTVIVPPMDPFSREVLPAFPAAMIVPFLGSSTQYDTLTLAMDSNCP